MIDERSQHTRSMRPGPFAARVQALPMSQTWQDGLAVLLGLALVTSAYLGWMSASHAQDNDCDVAIQSLD
jgi:hypothetical protein